MQEVAKIQPINNEDYQFMFIRSASINFLTHSYMRHYKRGWELDSPLKMRWSWADFKRMPTIRLRRYKYLEDKDTIQVQIDIVQMMLYTGMEESKKIYHLTLDRSYRAKYGDYELLKFLTIKNKSSELVDYNTPPLVLDINGISFVNLKAD